MADFTQINEEINAYINANGANEIMGAKLNQVLRDMIAAVNAEKQDPLTIDATPTEDSANPVQSGGMYVILSTMFADGCLYGGIVRPQDSPTFGDDHRYFYIATTNGRYVNFNNYEVDGYVVVFSWSENTQNWRYVSLCPNGQAFDDSLEIKADKVVGATSGNLAGLDEYGNLTDSGIAANEVATKADIAYLQQQIDELKNQ
jgi:hypothetical protein